MNPNVLVISLMKAKKRRNFDTMGIRIAVLLFCQKALIFRGFGLSLRLALPDKAVAR